MQLLLCQVESSEFQVLYRSTMNSNCEYCPHSLWSVSDDDGSEMLGKCWKLFHQPCDSCSLATIQSQNLCSFCQHLRLRHLVTCVPLKEWQRLHPLLRKGLVEDEVSRCSLCDMIRHTVRQVCSEHVISLHTGAQNSLLLLLGQSHARSSVAGIAWNNVERGTMGVGKLYINEAIGGMYYHGSLSTMTHSNRAEPPAGPA